MCVHDACCVICICTVFVRALYDVCCECVGVFVLVLCLCECVFCVFVLCVCVCTECVYTVLGVCYVSVNVFVLCV